RQFRYFTTGKTHFAPEAMYWRAVSQYSDPRSCCSRKIRRGTSKNLLVKRVGEQRNPVASLELESAHSAIAHFNRIRLQSSLSAQRCIQVLQSRAQQLVQNCRFRR